MSKSVRKSLSTLGASLVVALICSLTTFPARAATLDFSFSFLDANGAGQVDGIISGLMDDAISSASSVEVTSANYGVGEYIGAPTSNSFTVTSGAITVANFFSSANGANLGLFTFGAVFGALALGDPIPTTVIFTPVSSEQILPTPIPPAVFLLGTALAGMAGFNRLKRRRANTEA